MYLKTNQIHQNVTLCLRTTLTDIHSCFLTDNTTRRQNNAENLVGQEVQKYYLLIELKHFTELSWIILIKCK